MNQWIVAADGAVINLAHVVCIRVREQEGPFDSPHRYEAVAYLVRGGTVRLYESENEEECKDWLNDLASSFLEATYA